MRAYVINIPCLGYSWGIRGVFVGYSWDIRMYRVCVGYVSGMCRESVERYNEQGISEEQARRLRDKISCRYLQDSKKSSTFVENLGKCGFWIKNYEFLIKNFELRIKIYNHEEQEN